MNCIKEYVYDFVEGRVSVTAFLDQIEKNPEILEWLQSLVADWEDYESIVDLSAPRGVRLRRVPYDVYRRLQKLKDKKKSELMYHLNLHGWISKIMRISFPDDPPVEDQMLRDRYSFLIDVCPSYIGGGETEAILEGIINTIPDGLSKTAAKKWAREQIKQAFHVEAHHNPYWFQEPEWPVFDGRPMKYVRTEKLGRDAQNHIFVDLKTGIERIVFDAY